jgi:aspartate racemase
VYRIEDRMKTHEIPRTSPAYRTVGVLGGMGPDATVDFMSKVIAMTAAESDQHHIRMIVDHNPKVPNRQLAIRNNDPAVGRELASMALRLENAGADFLVMPCNSAHAFLEPIRNATTIPFISIIDVCIEEIAQVLPSARKVGVLATDGLLQAGLFQGALVADERAPILPADGDLRQLMTAIHAIKAGDAGDEVRKTMAVLARTLAEAGAEIVIAGCTEIPLVLGAEDLPVPLVASTDVLARRTVELATGRIPLPRIRKGSHTKGGS